MSVDTSPLPAPAPSAAIPPGLCRGSNCHSCVYARKCSWELSLECVWESVSDVARAACVCVFCCHCSCERVCACVCVCVCVCVYEHTCSLTIEPSAARCCCATIALDICRGLSPPDVWNPAAPIRFPMEPPPGSILDMDPCPPRSRRTRNGLRLGGITSVCKTQCNARPGTCV